MHIGIWLLLAAALASAGQTPQNPPEITIQNEPVTYKARVNLVMVPVVVRDRRGRVVGGLTKDDFRLFDKGQPQEISRFTVETMAAPKPASEVTPEEAPASDNPADRALAAAIPDRFIGYIFDDMHLDPGDKALAREAAQRHMDSEMRPTDRVAIFTTSGRNEQDFTSDLNQLHHALSALPPPPIPPRTAAEEDYQTQVPLSVLADAVRRISAMPGQRILVLVSGGFATSAGEYQPLKADIIDLAIRGNVIINSLDARGLFAPQPVPSGNPAADLRRMMNESVPQNILAELASGTGGVYFFNNNDLGEGFHRLVAAPEVYYLLGFQPQNLRLDGSFHALKVTLAAKNEGTVQARLGYFAPRQMEDAETAAHWELQEALFSREEVRDFPVEMHTQFTKGATNTATVTVLAHLDLKYIKFRQADGRNVDTVSVVSGLFDRNGNYVEGQERRIIFHLRPETLERKLESGINVRTTLEVPSGTYWVRLVVRDAEGQTISARNSAVDIP
jgi:VWFA-related protein